MKRWRRIRMGLQTLAGWPRGFFTPYRYAATVGRPAGYPELERVFAAAEPEMRHVLALIEGYGSALAELDGPPPLPRWGQSWFPRLDGAAAIAMVTMLMPKRIIEVGSGHSTRFLAEGIAWSGAPDCDLICIDPEPRADLHGLGLLRRRVLSNDDLEDFARLQAGDIAFFDSSHILWEGSDVDMILNRIMPMLASGVAVHIHDITLPDPYPHEWGWRGYTEQLGLAGYLTSPAWETLWSSHYAVTRMGAARHVASLPLPAGARETSLWLRRR